MLVYRVEKEDGLGPYMGGDYDDSLSFSKRYEMMNDHSDDRHPSPYFRGSGLARIEADEFCACDSLRNLIDWFYGFLTDLDEEGFHVSVYETDTARIGAYGQVCFRREDATRVDRFSFKNLDKVA